MPNRFCLTSTAIALLAASPLVAQDSQCTAKGSNGMVTLVLCPEGLDNAALRDAGIAACEGRKPCGAWIWDDAQAMPRTAPDSHEKLTKAEIGSAIAVWVNDADQLILLSEAKN